MHFALDHCLLPIAICLSVPAESHRDQLHSTVKKRLELSSKVQALGMNAKVLADATMVINVDSKFGCAHALTVDVVNESTLCISYRVTTVRVDDEARLQLNIDFKVTPPSKKLILFHKNIAIPMNSEVFEKSIVIGVLGSGFISLDLDVRPFESPR